MANASRVVGQVRVKIDGDLLDTDGKSTMDLGGPRRESVPGDYQAGSFRESTAEAKVEVNLLMKASLSLTALRLIDNATVTMETDVGHTFIVRNAYVADVISFGSESGTAKVVFQGPPAEQL
jgi:hypothetical protein